MAKTRQINVPIPSGLFDRAKKCAIKADRFFKAWIESAIRTAVERDEEAAK